MIVVDYSVRIIRDVFAILLSVLDEFGPITIIGKTRSSGRNTWIKHRIRSPTIAGLICTTLSKRIVTFYNIDIYRHVFT